VRLTIQINFTDYSSASAGGISNRAVQIADINCKRTGGSHKSTVRVYGQRAMGHNILNLNRFNLSTPLSHHFARFSLSQQIHRRFTKSRRWLEYRLVLDVS
jgi:hypothetical protein